MFFCVVLLSQPNSRDLDYPLWEVVYMNELKEMYKEKPGCVYCIIYLGEIYITFFRYEL